MGLDDGVTPRAESSFVLAGALTSDRDKNGRASAIPYHHMSIFYRAFARLWYRFVDNARPPLVPRVNPNLPSGCQKGVISPYPDTHNMTASIRKVAFYAFFVVLAPIQSASSQAQSSRHALTTAQWREDLQYLARELPKRHRNAFHKITQATFDSAVAALDARIPTLSDHEIVVGFASIVALLGDGHTRLALPQDPDVGFDRAHTVTDPPKDSSLYLHNLPVKLALFGDGLFVRAATPEYKALIGSRVVRIGRLRADSAVEAMRPVVNYDNEQGFLFIAPTLMPVPEVLHAMRITDGVGEVTMTLDRNGASKNVTLRPVQLFGKPRFIEARDQLATAPLWEKDTDKWYWLADLRSARTVYVQMNRIGSAPEENITDFARRIRRTYQGSGAQRVVIDLRHNPGGDGNMDRPLFTALVRDSAINRFGHLFVLIGRETFSAAQMLVNDFEHSSNAIFVGEPTGASPSGYGDSRKFKLPNSGLTVRASTIYWRDMDGDEKRAATMPYLPVALTATDYFGGRDPVLDAATSFDPATTPEKLVEIVQARAGWPQAMHICWAYVADPLISRDERNRGMSACGSLLQKQGEAKTAAEWFQAMINYLPDEPAGYQGLADALSATGDSKKAAEARAKATDLGTSRKFPMPNPVRGDD
jgi:Peptidase family S41